MPRLRFDPDLAAVHFDDALGYGEAQAGATLLAGDGIVGLLEPLKQLCLINSGDARSRTDTWNEPLFASALMATSPASVNLMALPTRLIRTCVKRRPSPWPGGKSRASSSLNASFLSTASGSSVLRTVWVMS